MQIDDAEYDVRATSYSGLVCSAPRYNGVVYSAPKEKHCCHHERCTPAPPLVSPLCFLLLPVLVVLGHIIAFLLQRG
jgi:hypothetical protein